MSYLVDTDILSEIRKRNRANPQVVAWFRQRQPRELYLSVLTLGELRRGVERIHRRDPTSATVLNAWLDRTLREFQDRIIGVDQAIADRWGRLGTPDPIPVIDGLIAATALERDLVVATRNVKHVAPTGVQYIDPFEVAQDRAQPTTK